jgi:hypothetical protein
METREWNGHWIWGKTMGNLRNGKVLRGRRRWKRGKGRKRREMKEEKMDNTRARKKDEGEGK